jgi:hypothetical protein
VLQGNPKDATSMTITRHGEPLLPVIRNSAFSRLSAMRGRKTPAFF